MVKVISFSLWGNNPKYVTGALRNAELARDLFPDWICRFYVGSTVSRMIQTRLINERDDLNVGDGWRDSVINERFCWISKSGKTQLVLLEEPGDWRGMFWRFEATYDPGVEVMISRDCDSRLSAREKYAIDEWLASDKGFHIMRDHPYHTVPILGGMWGMKKNTIFNFKELLEAWPKEDRLQTDQEFLAQKIWPLVQNNAMIHDGFFNHIWGGVPFPTNRKGLEFVGEVYDENDKPNQDHRYILSRYLQIRGEPLRELSEGLFE